MLQRAIAPAFALGHQGPRHVPSNVCRVGILCWRARQPRLRRVGLVIEKRGLNRYQGEANRARHPPVPDSAGPAHPPCAHRATASGAGSTPAIADRTPKSPAASAEPRCVPHREGDRSSRVRVLTNSMSEARSGSSNDFASSDRRAGWTRRRRWAAPAPVASPPCPSARGHVVAHVEAFEHRNRAIEFLQRLRIVPALGFDPAQVSCPLRRPRSDCPSAASRSAPCPCHELPLPSSAAGPGPRRGRCRRSPVRPDRPRRPTRPPALPTPACNAPPQRRNCCAGSRPRLAPSAPLRGCRRPPLAVVPGPDGRCAAASSMRPARIFDLAGAHPQPRIVAALPSVRHPTRRRAAPS